MEYIPKPLLCVLPGGLDTILTAPYSANITGAPQGCPGQDLSFDPKARWSLFPEISLNITDPLWSQKNLWFLNQILSSQRWRWNRLSFVNTEDRLWVVKHNWPYMGANCSIHREAQVPGGKHKSVKKGLWNKIMFCLEKEQNVWLNLWNTGMVCCFLWTSSLCVPVVKKII